MTPVSPTSVAGSPPASVLATDVSVGLWTRSSPSPSPPAPPLISDAGSVDKAEGTDECSAQVRSVCRESEERDAAAGCTDRDRAYEFEQERESRIVSRNCLRWAESLQALLNDAEGLNLFQQFLQQEDPDRFQMLEFWLACKGLSKQPPVQAHQLVRVIYAQLFLKAQLGIDEHLRRSITQQIKSDTNNKKLLSPTIFNEACAVVERIMNEVMHPNFLTSDIYLNYVQKAQNDLIVRSSPVTTRCCQTQREALVPATAIEPDDDDDDNVVVDSPPSVSASQTLAVVHEGQELTLCGDGVGGGGIATSTMTRRRGARSSSSSSSSPLQPLPPPHHLLQLPLSSSTMPTDSFSTKFLRQFGSVNRSNPSRRLYNYSYNPVSRQDSELQSLSSDARTDSMSDLSLDETTCTAKETYAYKRQLQRQLRSMRENASINKNSDLVFSLIPRTSNPHARESAKPLQPEEFAKNLIFKLEKLKKERDAEEIIVHKLNTVEDLHSEPCASAAVGGLSRRTLSEVIAVQRNDDDSQEILDNHLARVWSDKTPGRSPSQGMTPIRPKSPPDGRKVWPVHLPTLKGTCQLSANVVAGAGVGVDAHPYVAIAAAKKKDKDVCSLFSSDSGNGTDLAESGVEHRHRGSSNLVKSKSMPEQNEPYTSEYVPGYCQRGAAKAWSSSRRTLTDSGVSVVSGGRVENITPQSPQCKEKLVSSWLLDNNRICGTSRVTPASLATSVGLASIAPSHSGATYSMVADEKDALVVSSSSVKHKTKSNLVGGYAGHGLSRNKAGGSLPDRGNGNGSSSSSNGGAVGGGSAGGDSGSACSVNVRNVLPGQPFVADPSMPPFPFHSVDTDTQLEETRRRLNEMGPKLNRIPTTVAIGTASSAAFSYSKSCENSCSSSGGGAACVYPQTSSKTETTVTHRPTTLTRTGRKPIGVGEESYFTTVVYNFSDEQMPYLSRIPGNPITLRQFKDYMPKKGRYRYYFVTPCEDLEMQPIQEEITDDCEFLPLWKGKVIAQIRAIE